MKTKKKRNAKRRVLFLVLFLLLTVTILSTSIYAWFTANKVVTVSEIQVNVEAQGGIQISADGTNWKSVVATADLLGVGGTTYTAAVNQIPDTLKPVSTVRNVDATGKMEMYLGEVVSNVDGDYILTATKSTETNGDTGDFIAFDLFFRAEADSSLYMTTNSKIETPDTTDTGIKNSARIAFVNLGTTAIGSGIGTIQGLNTGAKPTYLWEPNYDVHTAAGVVHAYDTYGLTVAETGNASALAYSGISSPILATQNLLVGTVQGSGVGFAPETPTYTTVEDFSEGFQIFNLSAGITKLRIYMWVEGQDVDCENSASGGRINFNMQITNENPNAGP